MITREDLVEQSVTDYVRNALFVERGYPADQLELIESFPATLTEELTKSYVGAGFNFDNAGQAAEMGSDLTKRTYTLEFFVFGVTRAYAKNVANAIKFAVQRDGVIPLRDYEAPGAPVVDQMEVLGATADRQIVPDPEPWQEFIWLTTVNVEDVYHASLA